MQKMEAYYTSDSVSEFVDCFRRSPFGHLFDLELFKKQPLEWKKVTGISCLKNINGLKFSNISNETLDYYFSLDIPKNISHKEAFVHQNN
jgi:hypothetical protein